MGAGSTAVTAAKRRWKRPVPIAGTGSAMPTRGPLLDPTYKDAWREPLLRISHDFPEDALRCRLPDKQGAAIARRIRVVRRPPARIHAWREGKRKNNTSVVMRATASGWRNDDVDALGAWHTGRRPE